MTRQLRSAWCHGNKRLLNDRQRQAGRCRVGRTRGSSAPSGRVEWCDRTATPASTRRRAAVVWRHLVREVRGGLSRMAPARRRWVAGSRPRVALTSGCSLSRDFRFLVVQIPAYDNLITKFKLCRLRLKLQMYFKFHWAIICKRLLKWNSPAVISIFDWNELLFNYYATIFKF